jgi:hypothetical protein
MTRAGLGGIVDIGIGRAQETLAAMAAETKSHSISSGAGTLMLRRSSE